MTLNLGASAWNVEPLDIFSVGNFDSFGRRGYGCGVRASRTHAWELTRDSD